METTLSLLIGALQMLSVSIGSIQTAEAATVHVWTKPELVQLATDIATEHGLNAARFTAVVECETAHTWNPAIQSSAYNKRDGGREQSYGLVQIHLPDHSDISIAQAKDPNFALTFMAKEWTANRANSWTCYRQLRPLNNY